MSSEVTTALPQGLAHFPPTATTVGARKAVAVMSVDVAGYARLMELDEDGTHARLMGLRAGVLEPTVADHAGSVVKNTGDGFLAVFGTPSAALRAAAVLQQQLVEMALSFPPERRINLRIGLNFCVCIVEANDVYGEGVNIAARLQGFAEPGDIVLTRSMAQQVSAELSVLTTYDLGELSLKNIARPIQAVGIRIGSLRRIAAPAAVRALDARPSIAVLPFCSSFGDAGDSDFARSVVEEVTHVLAGVKELFVISHAATARYAGSEVDPRAVGRELGVRYVLTGKAARQSGKLQVSTELLEANSGRVINSRRYGGPVSDASGLLHRVSGDAVRTIAPNIFDWDLSGARRKPADTLNAYEIVLRALDELYRVDHASHSRARGHLQAAINLDPDYSSPYTYTALWHVFRVGEGLSTNPAEDAVEAARMARAALDRDANDALALAICGHVQSFLLRDLRTASGIFDRAIEIGPNCALAWSLSSLTLGYRGDAPEALERAERGFRLSPRNTHLFYSEGVLAQAHYMRGNFEDAIDWARKSAAGNPTSGFNLRVLAASLAALGRTDEAHGVASEIRRLVPDFRLSTYAPKCPFQEPILTTWLKRLERAGLPA